jgi:tellurite resistance protein TehA-like permease
MICFVCVPAWGKTWAYIAYGLWWATVLVSILINFGMVFVLFTRQQQTETTLAPTWLLPIVTTVVAAASGAIVSQALLPFNPALARGTILASYCVWGTGVPLAMMVITLIVYRMAIHGPPAPQALASSFLPLGPCGQGSYGIIIMGQTARRLAYEFGTPMIPGLTDVEGARRIADAMYAGGLVAGLVLWGLGLVWYTLAMLLFLDGWRKDWTLLGPGKFLVGLWGLTFPIG